jgi:RNA polymerase sigma-70 factor (ECF subfamily)
MPATPPRTNAANVAFFTTQWSVVLRAATGDSPEAAHALETLCATYWPPLYGYARRDGLSPHDAQDAVQDFINHLLRRDDLASVAPEKGRFRSFLLAALKNFLVSRARKERCAKRGGDAQRVFLDGEDAETLCQAELTEQLTPDKAFDRRWAQTIMSLALKRLREEHQSPQQARLFAALQSALADGGRLENQAELAAQVGISPGALATAATRLRRRYRALVEGEVRRTVDQPADVEAELRALREAWTQ